MGTWSSNFCHNSTAIPNNCAKTEMENIPRKHIPELVSILRLQASTSLSQDLLNYQLFWFSILTEEVSYSVSISLFAMRLDL